MEDRIETPPKTWLNRVLPKWFPQKPPIRITHCVHCGKECRTEDLALNKKIHIVCAIAVEAERKVQDQKEKEKRGQIEIVKAALRELESEKSSVN